VIQQCRKNRSVTFLLDGFSAGCREQLARLMVAKRRRLAFAAFDLRAFDAFDRVVADGVPFAEILEQRRQRREMMPECSAAKLTALEIVAPGDHMCPRHGAEFLRPQDTGETHEFADRVLVGAPGMDVPDIGEPLELGRDVGEPMKLGGGQQPLGRDDWSLQLGVVHDDQPR
jgi:hypothetical protein